MSLSIRGSGANTYLLAGTYGRGGYRLNISDIKQQASTVEEQISANTFTKLSTNVIDRKQAKVELTASIDGHALLSAKLYDYLGREVRNLYNDYTSGQARVQLDLSEIAAGKYFIVVSASGKSNSLGVTVL
jgi:hypothetical protein